MAGYYKHKRHRWSWDGEEKMHACSVGDIVRNAAHASSEGHEYGCLERLEAEIEALESIVGRIIEKFGMSDDEISEIIFGEKGCIQRYDE